MRETVYLHGKQLVMEYKTAISTSRISGGKRLRVVVCRIIINVTTAVGNVVEKCSPNAIFVLTNLNRNLKNNRRL